MRVGYRMFLSLFTNWTVGLFNGYKQKENGLPNGLKYGTMGLATITTMFQTLGNFESVNTPRQKIATLFIIVPLLIGTNFCVGHHMGKTIRYLADNKGDPSKDGIRINLL